MKFTKKKLFVTAVSVCLIAILSAGTLAWFSYSDTVQNKFMVADSSDTEPDDIFSVDVYEENIDGNVTDTGITYENILPGDVRVKDAHVKNTGYYDQYIRVIVEISDSAAWKAALGENFDNYKIEDCFVGFDTSKWNNISITEKEGNIQIVLYYNEKLASDQDIQLFQSVKIPTELTQEAAALFGGDFTIDIKAQAVQTENVVPAGTAKEQEAYKAFETVGLTY